MKLSIIIPCYNEAKHIAQVIDQIFAVDLPKEVIVVDDGSTDGTSRVLEELSKSYPLVLRSSESNSGKGAAIRAGLRYVEGDIVVIQDADLEYDPKQFGRLIQPILDGDADVVYGSRFRGEIRGMRASNRLANRILTLIANVLYGAHITDEATCYKAFRTSVIKGIPLKCTRFEFCPEVTAKIRKRGIRIKEVPISYEARTTNEGKKIRWTDAFAAVWTLVKYRFTD